jgi:hypothetical protein
MLKSILIVLSIFALGLSVSYSGTIDPNTPDQKYLEYAKDFHYVGKLCGTYKDKTNFCGSAVAIDDYHILTAAHVVKNSNSCFVFFNNIEYCIQKITIHKDFDNRFGIADIAIGYSEKPFNLKFYPPLYDTDDEIGKVCSISGYGITGTFNTGAVVSDQKKRAGSNIIEYSDKDMLICTPSRPTERSRTSLEFLIASGDSGGGLFIGDKLAGINSCVMAVDKIPTSKYNEESGHTRIKKFIPWIKEHKVNK